MEYKIKTKEVQPKMYAILFLNKEQKLQVIKLILAYSFEDAVGTGRQWIAKSFNLPLSEAIKFEPSMYESVPAKSLVEYVVDGNERVITDTNLIMKKIVDTEDHKEAQKLFTQNKHLFSDASTKYLKDEISKKKKANQETS